MSTRYDMDRQLATSINPGRLVVRPMLEIDVNEIIGYLADPRVAPFQYRFSDSRGDAFCQLIRFRDENPEVELMFQNFTITLDDRPVGHIVIQFLSQLIVGWNLGPEFWGNRIMPTALTLMYDRLFELNQDTVIISNCFPNNERCIRMMRTLGYQPVRLNVFDRIGLMLESMTLKRHARFRLDRQQFRNRGTP